MNSLKDGPRGGTESGFETSGSFESERHALVIVAHPDDETLWVGGTMLMHPAWSWRIVSLCRGTDTDRRPRFFDAMTRLGGRGDMGDLDDGLEQEMNQAVISGDGGPPHVREGLVLPDAPYYALWSYKLYCSERFDLLGNSLMMLSGAAPRNKAESIVDWIESTCSAMREKGLLSVGLPPNLFPFIQPEDLDWRDRYEKFNRPGEYHNGGIWPFVCGFYVAALVATGRQGLAERSLVALTDLCCRSTNPDVDIGFNEWVRAQDGRACGQDWQLWSASMYLYAAECVETGTTPLFETVRGKSW